MKRLGLFVLPFLFLAAGNSIIATVNYFWYGKFIVNELRSGSFVEANTALAKIADDENRLMVPVTKKMRMQAYEVSPKFRELQVFLENSENGFLRFGPGSQDDFRGGWFYWALRSAADQAGYHQTLIKSQKFYHEMAKEIGQALDEGRLTRKNQFSFLSFSWDRRYSKPFIRKFRDALVYATSFRDYNPYPNFHANSPELMAWFQNITLTHSCLTPDPELNQTRMNRMKYSLLKLIAKVTNWFGLPLTVLSVCCFGALTVLLVLSRRWGKYWIGWAILSGLFMMILARTALIAYLAVTQFNAIGTHYLNFVYPFILIFMMLSIFFMIEIFREFRRQNQAN